MIRCPRRIRLRLKFALRILKKREPISTLSYYPDRTVTIAIRVIRGALLVSLQLEQLVVADRLDPQITEDNAVVILVDLPAHEDAR